LESRAEIAELKQQAQIILGLRSKKAIGDRPLFIRNLYGIGGLSPIVKVIII